MTIVFADNPDQGRQEFDQSEIRSIPFFPVIDLTNFREVMRIESNISSSRVYHAALEAVAHVNGQLKKYRISAVQVGKSTLDETGDSDDVINGESVKTIHYRRAVYCYAKIPTARKIRRHRTVRQSGGASRNETKSGGRLPPRSPLRDRRCHGRKTLRCRINLKWNT